MCTPIMDLVENLLAGQKHTWVQEEGGTYLVEEDLLAEETLEIEISGI